MRVSTLFVQRLNAGTDAEKQMERRNFGPGCGWVCLRGKNSTLTVPGDPQERISAIHGVPQRLLTSRKEHVAAVMLNGHAQQRHQIGMLHGSVHGGLVTTCLEQFGIGTVNAFQNILFIAGAALTVIQRGSGFKHKTESAFRNLWTHDHATTRVERNDCPRPLAQESLDPVPEQSEEAHQCVNHDQSMLATYLAARQVGRIDV